MTVNPLLLGCDFSSAPSRKKQIVISFGRLSGNVVKLLETERFTDLVSWQQCLTNREWIGGFDLPFGLPRELVTSLAWPTDWRASVDHFSGQDKAHLRALFKAFCDARPLGHKFAHRATDAPAGSSPSMKWVNPPVAWMMHAGLPRILATGAHMPAHMPTDQATVGSEPPVRVAFEAYPGLLARELLGGPRSYKSDDVARQTPARWVARKDMLTALEQGRTRLGLRLKLSPAQADALLADATGDHLDAVLCLVQVAWAVRAHQQGHPNWGLPQDIDPLEGWILTA